jgi:hypothetical protein
MVAKENKKGQKQIDKENITTLAFYRNVSLLASGIYFAFTITLFDINWKCYFAMGLPGLVYLACYKFMSYMVDGGMDLTMEGGMGEHAKDLVLVTAIIQLLSLISHYFWWLWLVVPMWALYMLWVNILAPWFFAEPPPEMDEKKQKKMERKMKRQQVVYK